MISEADRTERLLFSAAMVRAPFRIKLWVATRWALAPVVDYVHGIWLALRGKNYLSDRMIR